jgi:hypothetical protein
VVTTTTPETLALNDTQFKPSTIGSDGTPFIADVGSTTRFVNARGRGIAVAHIKAGDRITVVWNEKATTPFSDTLVATRVVDNGPPPPVHYYAKGSATGAVVTTTTSETLTLSGTQFKPSTIGSDGSTFPVDVGSTTKFVNYRGKAIAEAKIKAGDRINVVWTEPSGTPFSDTLVATKVVDNGPPPPVHYYVSGRAGGAVVTTTTPATLLVTGTQFRPASIGTKGVAFTADIGSTTKFVGRRGNGIAEAKIKAGDRVTVVWTEPAGTPPASTLIATKVVDNSVW